jgi:hypothetical protein
METKQEKRVDVSKPKPDKNFQKVVWLQIYLPFIILLLILAAVVAVLWVGGAGSYSGWADTALVILMIPALLVGLVIFGVVAGLCYGVMVVVGLIPEPAKRAQEIAARIAAESRRFADMAARPMMVPKAVKSTIVESIHHIASIFSKEG